MIKAGALIIAFLAWTATVYLYSARVQHNKDVIVANALQSSLSIALIDNLKLAREKTEISVRFSNQLEVLANESKEQNAALANKNRDLLNSIRLHSSKLCTVRQVSLEQGGNKSTIVVNGARIEAQVSTGFQRFLERTGRTFERADRVGTYAEIAKLQIMEFCKKPDKFICGVVK